MRALKRKVASVAILFKAKSVKRTMKAMSIFKSRKAEEKRYL
jgi:fibrillarin-like rRNA methylase